jgi:hypothetical protein
MRVDDQHVRRELAVPIALTPAASSPPLQLSSFHQGHLTFWVKDLSNSAACLTSGVNRY